jgi:predicted nucleic acid-binding protein
MRYWDSSALVPLLVIEARTGEIQSWLQHDPQVTTWWGTDLECVSAIMRRERERQLRGLERNEALRRLSDLATGWQEIEPTESQRQQARRLLAVHPLRAADAMQLAAAFIAANQQPATLEFVCLDDRLADAARREGFPVLGR